MGRSNKKTNKKKEVNTRPQEKSEGASLRTSSAQEDDGDTESSSSAISQYSADQLLQKAEEYLDEMNPDLAQKFLERALELGQDNASDLERAGSMLLELGLSEKATSALHRAVELSPEKGHLKYMYLGQLGIGKDSLGSFKKGISLMEEELAHKRENGAGAGQASLATCGSRDKEVTSQTMCEAYCAIAELFMTDLCMEEDAEGKCEEAINKALSYEPSSSEALQLLASFRISCHDNEGARESLQKSVETWLPRLGHDGGASAADTTEAPLSYEHRTRTAQMAMEVRDYQLASEVLERLLDEDDQVVQVWYLLGWLNYLQGNDFKANARHYLTSAMKTYEKVGCEDQDLVDHAKELLQELSAAVSGAGGDVEEEEEEEEVAINPEEVEQDLLSSDDEQAMES